MRAKKAAKSVIDQVLDQAEIRKNAEELIAKKKLRAMFQLQEDIAEFRRDFYGKLTQLTMELKGLKLPAEFEYKGVTYIDLRVQDNFRSRDVCWGHAPVRRWEFKCKKKKEKKS